MVRVTVTEGVLEGDVLHNNYSGKMYNSFKGIPYAEPPIGDLRFKAPQPPKPWNGIREAKEFGNKSLQFDVFTREGREGSEDCLYLNVYTPNIKPAKPLPVLFWIPGGAFIGGSGQDDFYGPKFIMNQDVLLVTFNYRLEVLGFLCLDTEDIPGNAGMKDQVAALKWVHKNISNFGGDPTNITIGGDAAGGASASYHCMSPMSKGLFKRAIVMSGASTCHWAQAWEPRERALALAKRLGCQTEDDKELHEFFKKQPAESLIEAQAPITMSERAQTKIECYFSIVDEKKFGENERFFYGDMFEVLSSGVHEGIDVLIGYVSDEGLINIGPNVNAYKAKLDVARKYPEFFVSKPLSLRLPIYQQYDFGTRMKKYYFRNFIKDDDWEQLVKFYSMDMFVFGIMQWAKAVAKTNNNVYVYRFSCATERNIVPNILGIGDLVKNKRVCSQGDDLAYIFNGSVLPSKIEPKTYELIQRVSRLWTNFVKYGNPTPDNALDIKWLPYSVEKPNYMEIGNVFQTGTAPDQEELEFWTDLFRQFGQRVF